MTAQPKVFISYRREDDGGYARGVRDGVAERFGSDSVFLDLKIGPGEDFVERITEAVAGCAVLLVLMGPRWATVVKNGRPRIEDPKDFVRLGWSRRSTARPTSCRLSCALLHAARRTS